MTIYVYPTDTLWGIGCNIYDRNGADQICQIKKTGAGKPVSILFHQTELLETYFDFPKKFTTKWLEIFFEYESTLLIPLEWALKEIPQWITVQSNFIGVRCISNGAIERIGTIEKAPIITTSLNITGDAPIFSEKEARIFVDSFCPQCLLLGGGGPLSGRPSSIVQLGKTVNFLRRGTFEAEIIQHLGLLTA